MFAENRPVKAHNETMLCKLPTPLISINAVDEFPSDCS